MFGQMKASRRRDEFEAWRKDRENTLHIRQALGMEIMPDDLEGMRPEFLERLMGKEKAREYLLNEHIRHVKWRARQWRTLRCWFFDCKPAATCTEWATCDVCAGACVRCSRPVLPTARIARR